jgi:hypothetical protein
MTAQERVRLAAAMSDEIRELARAGIRCRRPESTPEEVAVDLEDLLLGAAVAEAARAGRRRVAE